MTQMRVVHAEPTDRDKYSTYAESVLAQVNELEKELGPLTTMAALQNAHSGAMVTTFLCVFRGEAARKSDAEDAYWELLWQLLAARTAGSDTMVTPGPKGRWADEIYLSNSGKTLAVFQLVTGGVKCFVGESTESEFVGFKDTTRLLEIIKQFNTKK